MDLADFEDGLDRYGADLTRWPSVARSAAEAFLEHSAEGRAALRAMAEVEAVLRSDRAPSTQGAATLAARAMRHVQDRPLHRMARGAGWAVTVTLALVLGLLVGGGTSEREDGPDHVMAASFETLGQTDVD